MSKRIATEKYCLDLGGKLFNPKAYNLTLAVPEEELSTIGASVLYCPINGKSTTIGELVYKHVYYIGSSGELSELGGLYIALPRSVYSGLSISLLYDITYGGTTLCEVIISIMGADLTCSTKADAVNFGCEVVNESNYADDQLIPQVEVSEMPKCTVKYNRNYLSLDELGRYSKHTRRIEQTSDTYGFYYTSDVPYADELTVDQLNTKYVNVKGSSCIIKLRSNPKLQNLTVTPLLIESVLVVSESTGEVLAEGTLPLVFTLNENCWIKFTGDVLCLRCAPPTFVGEETPSLKNLDTGKVTLVNTTDDVTGSSILTLSNGFPSAYYMAFTPGLHLKYLYFYTSNYYSIYNTNSLLSVFYAPLLINSETGEEYNCGLPVRTRASGGTGGVVVLNRPINESWYALPQDLPMTGHYTITWVLKSSMTTSTGVLDIKTQRTLTVINNGVGTVTVNGATYTQPIVYENLTTANIDWNGKADVEVSALSTRTYEKLESLSIAVAMDTTVTLTPTQSPICEYNTINDTKLSFSSNRWAVNLGITTHKYIEDRDLYEVYTLTDLIYTANKEAFKGHPEVKTVKCFSGCSTGTFLVPDYCYLNCTGLTSALFSVPSMSITYGTRAFELCAALNTVTLSDNITSFGEGCFSLSGITSFTCPSKIKSIPNQLCYSCGNLSTVDLSKATSLTSIGEEAFAAGISYAYGTYINPITGTLDIAVVEITQSNLTSVKLPKSVSSLGKKAFANNYLLEILDTDPVTGSLLTGNGKMYFSVDSSTYKSSLTSIPERGFAFCSGLKSVSLPSSVTTLGTYAFYGTSNLKYFQAPGLTYVHAEALKGRCESDIKLSNCTKVGSLYKETDSEGIYFTQAPLNNQAGLTTEYPFEIYIKPNKNADKYILYKLHARLFGASTLLATRCDTTILPGTLSIAPYAYANKNYRLSSFLAPAAEEARSIGSGANGRFQVKNVYMSNCSNLFKIGEYAFYNTFAERVVFPTAGSITSLGKGAFRECTRLSILDNLGVQKITEISDLCFYNCGKNGTGIGAFESIDKTQHPLSLPSTLTRIGNYAFYQCPLLMMIDGGLAATALRSIGDYAFYDCFSISPKPADIARIITYCGIVVGSIALLATGIITAGTSLIVAGAVGATVTPLVGELCMEYMGFNDDLKGRTLANVVFPYTTSIGKYCFANCKYLETITLGKVTTIPEGAFYNCDSLSGIGFHDGSVIQKGETHNAIPSLVKTVGKAAFAKCNNLDYTAMNYILSHVERIEAEAFYKCKKLGDGQLALPKSLTYLGEKCFDVTGGITLRFLGSTPPTMHSNVFGNTMKSRITCYVPTGSKNAYVSAFGDQVKSNKIIEITLSDSEKSTLQSAGFVI